MSDEVEGQPDALFPKRVKRWGCWVSLTGSLVILAYFVIYILGYVAVSPTELGLANLLMFSLACFLFFAIPWNDLGLGLRRFGPLEFERKLEGQSEERVKDIAALEEKIEKLESLLGRSPSGEHYTDPKKVREEADFKSLVVKFLSDFDERAFSPVSIERWGARQPGYAELSGHSELLRKTLRRLVVDGLLETSVSQRGNTLYRIKK